MFMQISDFEFEMCTCHVSWPAQITSLDPPHLESALLSMHVGGKAKFALNTTRALAEMLWFA